MEVYQAAQNELDKKFRAALIIVSSQIATAIALIIFAFIFVKNADSPASFATLMPLWIGVLFIAVGAFLLRRRLNNWERLKNVALLKGIGGLMQTLQINVIVLGALAELIAAFGVLITYLSGNNWDSLRAGAVSLMVFAVIFPRKVLWTKIVSALESK